MSSKKSLIANIFAPEFAIVWIMLLAAILEGIVEFSAVAAPVKIIAKIVFLLGATGMVIFMGTRLVNTNKKLSNAFHRLEKIVETLQDGVIVYDIDFKVLVFNIAAEQIFKIKKEEIVGTVLTPQRSADQKFQFLVQTMFPSLAPSTKERSEPGSLPHILDISFLDPEREIRVFTNPIVGDDGETIGFIKIAQDRTREIQLDRSKSQFVAVAAHQLRTPLTAIGWTFDTLMRSPNIVPEDKQFAENGAVAATKLLKIVNDLLDTSRIEEGRFGYTMKDVDVIPYLEGILKNAMSVGVAYGVKVYFDKGGYSTLMLRIDPDKLGIAISNFIDNAIKYNVQNGSLTVRIRPVPNKPYIELLFEDTGIGIPAAEVDKLFAKFFRAENAQRLQTDGSGLGLYISKNIIERHGGAVWVESIIKRGTTIHFTLPTDPTLIPPKEFGIMTR